MAHFKPYQMDKVLGDGVRWPIRQCPVSSYDGSLDPKISAMLYRKRHAMPNPYGSMVRANTGVLTNKASSFAQYGRGKKKVKRVKKVTHYGGIQLGCGVSPAINSRNPRAGMAQVPKVFRLF